MKSTVLKSFDYSFDGVKAIKAKPGDVIDFRDMTTGLLAEGYVEAVADEPAPAPEPVVEPVQEPEPVIEPVPEPEPVLVIEAAAAEPTPVELPPERRKRR